MGSLDMLGSPHSSNGGSNGDGNGLSSVGPPMTPLPPGMSDHLAAAAAQVIQKQNKLLIPILQGIQLVTLRKFPIKAYQGLNDLK